MERLRRLATRLLRMALWLGLVLAVLGAGYRISRNPPLQSIGPGERGVRVNRWTGGMAVLGEGEAVVVPFVHDLRRYSVRGQVYRPEKSATASGAAPFRSIEGLGIGAQVTVEYALDPTRILDIARTLPADIGRDVIQPAVDGILHRTLAKNTVRDIFAARRSEIQQSIEKELKAALLPEGILVRGVSIGSVDLPGEYRQGLESLLTEELSAEKMRYTLELKEKQIKQTELEGEATKVQRQKAAEASAAEEVIAAKGREEAMKHVLPLKEKEIEQRKLEAEATAAARLKQAEGESAARKIEAEAEADTRRKLAEADAYRIEVTGKASTEQLARDSELIAKNPLLIQKTVADKLSDKIQVVVAPPPAGGFFADAVLRPAPAPPVGVDGARGERGGEEEDP